jgi:hypothetical protein
MTEAEWRACRDPEPMQKYLRGQVTDRQWRFFVAACHRRVWYMLENRHRKAVEVVEANADRLPDVGGSDPSDILAVLGSREREDFGYDTSPHTAGWTRLGWVASIVSGEVITAKQFEPEGCSAEIIAQADLFREIVGNPFHPVEVERAWLRWNDGAIPKMVQSIREVRELPAGTLDVNRMAILADALEDAGCTEPWILEHLRGAGPHVRGCFVLDLLRERP